MREQEDLAPLIATIVPANVETVKLPFLWYPPRMREWVGSRQYQRLEGEMLTISTKTYEATALVPRTVVEDQVVSLIEPKVRQMGAEYQRFLNEQLVNTLRNGNTLTTFDGKPLLTSSASDRGANNVNLLTASLDIDNLQQAVNAMWGFTEPIEGRPLGMRPTHLLVGPRLQFTARELLNSQTIVMSGGASTTVRGSANVLQGILDLIVTEYIPDNSWFVIAAGSNNFRPVIRVDRTDVPIEFTAMSNPTDQIVFDQDSYAYGVRARHGFGPGAWFAVVASFVS
jgi:phage major head subunit gpT-like protein